jgi:cytochrome c biogenesis protein CcdA
VFLTYVLVGLGIFEFLYSINKFYIITKILYYLIAAFCFILAIFATYDLWVFKKTGKTDGLTLQLPQAVKNRIHSIIGLHYRKSQDQKSGSVSKSHLLRLIASAFITGFLVSLLEAVCTGQVYLPTISFILKYTSSFRVRAFTYLLLYNIMFIVPLLIVLIFALFGTTSESFSRFVKKHMEVIKLSMALLFLGLGILILMKA